MQGPGGDPVDAALANIVGRQAAPTPAHQVGLSPADKAYTDVLKQQAEDTSSRIGDAVEQNRDAVKAFGDQSDSMAIESRLAAQTFAQQQEENAKKRAALETETQERQKKTEAKIAELEAQGVNPNHYWESQTTGQKIAAAIAIGLGTFAAHPLGPHGQATDNVALGIINNAIASDIDAQKANLTKGLDLAKTRMALDEHGFDHQTALLAAERDSIQSAYTVAGNDLSKRMAQYKDNADFQTKGAALQAGLLQSRDQLVAGVNDKIFGIQKGAERVVGGTGAANPAAAIVKRAQEIADKGREAGHEVSPEQARRLAAEEILGIPGNGAAPSLAKAGAGAKPNARLVRRLAELDASDKGLTELDGLLRKGSGLSMSDRARVDQQIEELKARGIKLPEGGLGPLTNTTAHRARVAQALLGVRAERQSILSRGASGTEPEETPESLGLEKDE